MAWITTKDGKHINTDWFEKDKQIAQNKAEANSRNSVITQEEAEALRKYTGSAYANLNDDLRNGYSLSNKQETYKQLLDSAIAKQTLSEPITVYRGTSGAVFDVPMNIELRDIQQFVGKEIYDKAYMSTSFKKEGAYHDDILFSIKVPSGKGVGIDVMKHYAGKDNPNIQKSPLKRESEFLIARNSGLKILGVKKVGNRFEVDAELIKRSK